MKKDIKTIIAACCLLATLVSCSNDNNGTDDKGGKTTQGLQFSFNEADYDEDKELSRAASKPAIVNLGDCEAEVTVENNPDHSPAPSTRPIANKHYTIRAYQSGVKKGEISGTFNGSTFTPDATSGPFISLKQHGSYDFVAFNDDVVPVGENLTVAPDKAGTARIGVTTANINQEPEQHVSFEMKHVGARVKVELSSKKHFQEPLKAFVRNVDNSNSGIGIVYNPTTQAYSKGSASATQPTPATFPISSEPLYVSSGYGDFYGFTSANTDYFYLLPGTTDTKVRLQFTEGTHFWKSLAGMGTPILFTPAANGSYKVKIKMKARYTYLFNDGTTGFLTAPENASKKAVGIVVEPGLAIAMKDIPNSNLDPWSQSSTTFSNLHQYKNRFDDAKQTNDGYEITWDGSQTANPPGVVKANDQINFPLFYRIGRYENDVLIDKGIPITGTLVGKKWFLPSLGEWIKALKTLGFLDETPLTGYGDNIYIPYPSITAPFYYNMANMAFGAAGGEYLPGFPATANEYDESGVIRLRFTGTGVFIVGNSYSKYAVDYFSRAFIRY